jgi:MraZ protein
MTASSSNDPIYYNSQYRHGIDDKRRLQIPAKWRPADPGTQFTLVLWPNGNVAEACLLVLPPAEWAKLVDKVRDMAFADPRAETLRRILGRKSDRVALDKAGRICLPESMARPAALEKEAILVGLLDRFQIWNPERYDATTRVDEQLSQDAFKLI